MRIAIFGTGALATAMGIMVESIYGLWFLCADLVYVVLFPQLVSVIYIKGTNTYGSLAGYIVGLLLRILGGEAIIGLPPVINYFGMLSANNVQLFPFKSFCMLMTFVTIIIVSFPIKVLFEREILPKHLDVFQCVVNISEESIALRETLYEMNGDTGSHSKREAVAAMHSKINPALKFSKEDLLSVPEDNLPDASPIDNDPPTKIKDES